MKSKGYRAAAGTRAFCEGSEYVPRMNYICSTYDKSTLVFVCRLFKNTAVSNRKEQILMPINYSNVELAVTAGLRDQFPRDNIVQIALSGRSNVGKSSFINRVCQRKNLARVSGSPGKTITLNFYLIDHSFYLVDLPDTALRSVRPRTNGAGRN